MLNPFSIYNPGPEKNRRLKKNQYNKALDWEESVHGQNEDPDDYYESQNSRSLWFFVVVLFLIFAGLASRLLYLQVAQGSYYRKLADGNHVRIQSILAPRGIIYDAQGNALVQNVPSFELVVTPSDLPKNYEPEIRSLAQLLNFDPTDVLNKVRSTYANSFLAITVVPNMAHDQALVFEDKQRDYPGFSIQNNPIRQYQDAQTFSDVLGYTGKISEAELTTANSGKQSFDPANPQQGYLPNDYIGKTGLEYNYEKYLKGVNGQTQVQVDASGNIKSVIGQVDPTAGNNVFLNIDGGLQRELYNEIVSKNGNKKAAAVAMNPQTGQILALVSVPGYDNNMFSKSISPQQYQALVNDPNRPLFNRAISGTYPPGSTIKPVIASAALQERVIDQNTKILDNGDLVVGSFHFHGWKAGGLGQMDVRSAIAMSSDIYFYTVGGGQDRLGISGLGPERLEKYDYLFGMGQKLGIDLQGEAAGMIASPEWRQQHYKDPAQQKWYLGDTYHESIGQGDMAVTPLQVAEWTSAVANGGTLYQPYIVDKITDGNGKVVLQNQPHVIRAGFIDPQNIQIVREGMRQTVIAGTARSLSTLPITAAGKTGTAQFDFANPKATHAWFTAFAPYENPKITITVLIEAGGEGSSVSEPIVKDALAWWAKNR